MPGYVTNLVREKGQLPPPLQSTRFERKFCNLEEVKCGFVHVEAGLLSQISRFWLLFLALGLGKYCLAYLYYLAYFGFFL
jgi:hypothetical protein